MPRLSSYFGFRSDPLRGTPRLHAGIDIPGRVGTPVHASASGIVRFTGIAGGYGQMVELAHGGGLDTRYAHLSRILVRPGDVVARGDTIALMGSTGRSTGSHLHFEVRSNGRAANPLAYLGAGPLRETREAAAWGANDRAASGIVTSPHISKFARTRSAQGGAASR